jgi:hypothetical protein
MSSEGLGLLLGFLKERFPGGSARISARDLYQEWVSWCGCHGMKPGTKTLFGRRVKGIGFGSPSTLSFKGVQAFRDGRGVAYRITPMRDVESWRLLEARQGG